MTIDEIIREVNNIARKMYEDGELSKRVLAIAVECNQIYADYLDYLQDNIRVRNDGITVAVDGKKIKFQNADSMAAWIAEVMQ
jgi:hypothetical protein